MEIWVDIPRYEGIYKASNKGRIKSLDRNYLDKNNKEYTIKGKIKKFFLNKNGYLTVSLSKNGKVKTEYVHYLILSSFTNLRENSMTVNHKDEVKTNNKIENLEWLTNKQNNLYGTKVKRTSDKKFKKRIKIDKETLKVLKVYENIEDLLNDGYKLLNTKMCCMGINKSAHGFVWKYLEVNNGK